MAATLKTTSSFNVGSLRTASNSALPPELQAAAQEARLASSLTHDNICSIVDFGEDEQAGLFMVMVARPRSV
jgi:hypothetical protein